MKKIDALFRLLKRSCKEELGFNPIVVSDRLRYHGPLQGKLGSTMHVFRDQFTSAPVILSASGLVRLSKDWTEADKAAYLVTNEEANEAIKARMYKVVAFLHWSDHYPRALRLAKASLRDPQKARTSLRAACEVIAERIPGGGTVFADDVMIMLMRDAIKAVGPAPKTKPVKEGRSAAGAAAKKRSGLPKRTTKS